MEGKIKMEDLVKQLIKILTDGYQIAYFCDPDNANELFHHLPVPVPKNIAQEDLPWRFHLEKPAEDLKDAIWSDSDQAWIDNSGKSLPLQVNQLTRSIKTISDNQKAKDQQVDNTLKALQEVQQTQTSMTAVVGQLLPAVQQLSQFAASLQKTAPEATEKEGDK